MALSGEQQKRWRRVQQAALDALDSAFDEADATDIVHVSAQMAIDLDVMDEAAALATKRGFKLVASKAFARYPDDVVILDFARLGASIDGIDLAVDRGPGEYTERSSGEKIVRSIDLNPLLFAAPPTETSETTQEAAPAPKISASSGSTPSNPVVNNYIQSHLATVQPKKNAGCGKGCLISFLVFLLFYLAIALVPNFQKDRELRQLRATDATVHIANISLVIEPGRKGLHNYVLGSSATLKNDTGEGWVAVRLADTARARNGGLISNHSPWPFTADLIWPDGTQITCAAKRSWWWSADDNLSLRCPWLIREPEQVSEVVFRIE